ncbi:MAG: hypothetical protein WC523_00540 [Patescibacteria group bacterium]
MEEILHKGNIMSNPWFINNPTVLGVLQVLVTSAGPNFTLPYDSSLPLPDGVSMISDDLLKYKLPGGSIMQSMSEPGITKSMGTAINNLLSLLSPFMSAYMLLLPIMGVIRGLIEIICAMPNWFAVIRAVIRLFRKWLPPFIALFPPLAGILLVLGIIKLILAAILFVLTTIIPIYELIKHDVSALIALLNDTDSNRAQIKAERRKIEALLVEILNQIGVLNVLKPILETIMAILRLAGGRPCKKGNGDETCCGDDTCPPVLTNPPKGIGAILKYSFSDSLPLMAWKIKTLTGNSQLYKITPYMQSLKQQLDSQLDEPVDEAVSAGQTGNSSHFSVRVTNNRGNEKIIPILKIKNPDIIVVDPTLSEMIGAVRYEIVPNWDMLVAHNIVGLGCHPSVIDAKDSLDNQFGDTETPAAEQIPELADIGDQFDDMLSGLNDSISRTRDSVANNDVSGINAEEENITNDLNAFGNNMKRIMNTILSHISNTLNSELNVNKNFVKAGGSDLAVISVIPRDSTGALLASNLPDGVGITVDIFTDFGVITNQTLNNSTGIVTAEIRSLLSGTATVTARINGEFIEELDNNSVVTKEIEIKFVSGAVLPKRRLTSKQSTNNTAHTILDNVDREPGGK